MFSFEAFLCAYLKLKISHGIEFSSLAGNLYFFSVQKKEAVPWAWESLDIFSYKENSATAEPLGESRAVVQRKNIFACEVMLPKSFSALMR